MCDAMRCEEKGQHYSIIINNISSCIQTFSLLLLLPQSSSQSDCWWARRHPEHHGHLLRNGRRHLKLMEVATDNTPKGRWLEKSQKYCKLFSRLTT